MNDLFAKMWLENGSFQESDTHWRCGSDYVLLVCSLLTTVTVDVSHQVEEGHRIVELAFQVQLDSADERASTAHPAVGS